jgi:hypothetical protein
MPDDFMMMISSELSIPSLKTGKVNNTKPTQIHRTTLRTFISRCPEVRLRTADGAGPQKNPDRKTRSGISLFYPQMESWARRRPRSRYPICSGRSSDFRIFLPAAPSHSESLEQWYSAAFVPDYSGGPVPDFNGVPF